MGTKGTWRRSAAISPLEEDVAWRVAFGKDLCPDCHGHAPNAPAMWDWVYCLRHSGPEVAESPEPR